MNLSDADYIVAIDNSASMQNKSVKNPSQTRFTEVQEMTVGIAAEISAFDADGIDLIIFGQGATLHKGVTVDKVAEVFSVGAIGRYTDTHVMVKMAAARQKEKGKPTVVVVFTDGDATDRNSTASALIEASNDIQADSDLTFGFVQVGDDPKATEFLTFLDEELKKRGAKFDIVDTIPAEIAARMSAPEMLMKFVQD